MFYDKHIVDDAAAEMNANDAENYTNSPESESKVEPIHFWPSAGLSIGKA